MALAGALTACSGTTTTATPGTGTPGTGTSGTGTPGTGTTPGTGGAGVSTCAWPTRADKQTLNIAYPDTAATYWGFSYNLAPGEHLEMAGTYPSARYFSFITYGPNGGALTTLSDRDIPPDPGSTNPFAGGDPGAPAGQRRYTAQIRPEQPGTVLYRVYVPSTDGDPTGGVGLPAIRIVGADGSRREVPMCPNPGPNENAVRIVNENGPATDTPAPAQPVFIRPKGTSANLYPNPDNVYVATITKHQPGQVVVVRGKAPTFPDTRQGKPITGSEQVRYWSMCTNEYRKPYPVTECATDDRTALDAQGWFTYVISTPQDRPANATADNGVTWLDWGPTTVDGLLLMRHMLAEPGFAESAVNLQPGALATTTMGDYAPKGAYCTKATFESGGAKACGL